MKIVTEKISLLTLDCVSAEMKKKFIGIKIVFINSKKDVQVYTVAEADLFVVFKDGIAVACFLTEKEAIDYVGILKTDYKPPQNNNHKKGKKR
jgi:hypothetical protein